MTSKYSIYIPLGIICSDYRPEYFAAYIDSGSGTCLCKATCYPEKLKETLNQIRGRDISNRSIKLNYGIKNPKIILGNYIIKIPPFYFHDTGVDVLLGNNFLQIFKQVIFNYERNSIRFLTPCFKWIYISRIKNAFARKVPINFRKRSKLGDSLIKRKTDFTIIPLLKYIPFRSLQEDINDGLNLVLKKIQKCYAINPLEFWEKNKILAKLELKDKDKIIRVKPMRHNEKDVEEFRNQLKELMELKLIEESQSPHSSPAFMVRNHAEIKRGKARMVINYKALNTNTIFDGYFLPHKDTLINMTRGKRLHSKFDCKSGFYQIKLSEDSKALTAFSTPQGHYEWNVMPFGLKNAPHIFQRKMDNIFKPYNFIHVYVDDILISSKNMLEHIKHLNMFAKESFKNGLVLFEKKSVIAQEKIDFLGLNIDYKGIEMQDHISKKIILFPDKLEDKKQLQRFLGVLNYAEAFIEHLAEYRKPLQKLLRKMYLSSLQQI